MSEKKPRKRRPVLFAKKWVYQRLFSAKARPKNLLFVFGCQRSGTSMFTQLFRNDLRAKVYGERGLAVNGGFDLLPLNEVRTVIEQEHAQLLVSKPLVESQNARKILDYFPEAKGVWMFRAYADVAYSSQQRFSRETAMRNLRGLLSNDAEQTFSTREATTETRAVVTKFFAEDMSGDEAQILFWFVRNILFYEQNLQDHDRVQLCRYESLVDLPAETMLSVYRALGMEFPGSSMVAGVHRRSVGRNVQLDAKPELVALCEELQQRMIRCASGNY